MAKKRKKQLSLQPKNILNLLRKSKQAMSCKEIAVLGASIKGTFKNPKNISGNVESVYACIKDHPDIFFSLTKKRHKKFNPLAPNVGAIILKEWKGSRIWFPVNINTNIIETGNLKMNQLPESGSILIGDNLKTMRQMPENSVHLIYTDPPYNSGVYYKDERGEFDDKWSAKKLDKNALKDIQGNHKDIYKILEFVELTKDDSMHAYLTFMAVRIIEMHRILKTEGSIYLHVDSTSSHYLKLIMDAVFGRKNYRREIIVANNDCSGFKGQANNWIRGSDTILYYTKSNTFTFHRQYDPRQSQSEKSYNKFDKEGRRYKLYKNKDGTERKSYWDPRGVPHSSVWTDIPSFQTATNSPEYLNYPTQKPLKLLNRIVSASSNKDDIVFDPFMGSGVALLAARDNNRKWIGCDLTQESANVTKERLQYKLETVSPSLLGFEDEG